MKLSSEKRKQLLDLTVKFNEKIKQYPYGVKLPKYLNYYEELNRIERRGISEFNRVKSSYSRFITSPPEIYTTQQGVNITLWEKNEIDKAIKTTNKKLKQQLSKYEPSVYKGTLSLLFEENLMERKNNIEKISPKYFDKYSEGVIRAAYRTTSEKNYQLKDNYLSAVIDNYGEDSELYKFVSKLSPSKIAKGIFSSPVLSVKFVYREESEDFESEILSAWQTI